MDMWVPLNKKINKHPNQIETDRVREVRENFFFLFFLSSFLYQIHGNRTVEILWIKNESALRNEGYAWVPKTRDFTENSGKNSEKS